MLEILTLFLLLPLILTFATGIIFLLDYTKQRHTDRLQSFVKIVNCDVNGNYPVALDLKSGTIALLAVPGQKPTNYPALTHFTYSPNFSTHLSGKPLNVGNGNDNRSMSFAEHNREFREIAFKRYQDSNHSSQEGQEGALSLEDVETLPQLEAPEMPDITPFEAVKALKNDGLSLREIGKATGLSYYAVQKLASNAD